MGLKKRNKPNAQFNMSSLTDIIFLLLIFFMLTSSMIVPNALNLKLPGKKSTVTTSKQPPNRINIANSGTYRFNGNKISLSGLDKKIRDLSRGSKDVTVTITPSKSTPNQSVVAVMDMAYRYKVIAALTDPK